MSRRALPEALTPLTAEASVLGGVLVRPAVLDKLAELEVDHFVDYRHKVVFAAMRSLAAAGTPIDHTTLEQEIARGGKLEAVGGIAFLGELAINVPTPDNVLAYAKDVRVAWRNREALLALDKARSAILADFYPAAEVLEETAAELARFNERSPAPDTAPPRKWVTALSAFLGDDGEPDEDDSPDWIIRDVIPRAAPMLFPGPAKAGKTWTAIDMAVSIATGQPWIGFENCLGRPGRVVVLCREDGVRRLRKRLWELCRARNVVPFERDMIEHLVITTAALRMPGPDVQRFGRELRDWQADVVIVDNLSRVIIGDPNKTQDASNFAHAWYELGEISGAAVCFLHHTKKEQGDARKDADPFDAVRGSGDLVAAARHVVLAKPVIDETNPAVKRSEIRMRGNLDLRRESFVLGFERFADPRGRTVAAVTHCGDLDDLRAERRRFKQDQIAAARDEENRVRRALAIQIVTRDGNVSQAKLATALGLSSRAVADLLNGMVEAGQLVRAGRSGYGLPALQVQIPGSAPQPEAS